MSPRAKEEWEEQKKWDGWSRVFKIKAGRNFPPTGDRALGLPVGMWQEKAACVPLSLTISGAILPIPTPTAVEVEVVALNNLI